MRSRSRPRRGRWSSRARGESGGSVTGESCRKTEIGFAMRRISVTHRFVALACGIAAGWASCAAVAMAALPAASIATRAPASAGGRIDRARVRFGIEYTFQDEEMVNEPGRMTVETP